MLQIPVVRQGRAFHPIVPQQSALGVGCRDAVRRIPALRTYLQNHEYAACSVCNIHLWA